MEVRELMDPLRYSLPIREPRKIEESMDKKRENSPYYLSDLLKAVSKSYSEELFNYVKTILESDFNVNEISRCGETALFTLLRNNSNNHFKNLTLEALLWKGADVNQVVGGRSALCCAIDHAVKCSRYITLTNRDHDVKNRIEVVKILLKHGAKVNLSYLYFFMEFWNKDSCRTEYSTNFRALSKLLIQYAVAKNFDKVFSNRERKKKNILSILCESSTYYRFLKLNSYVYNLFSSFCDACTKEVARMRKDYISSNYTMYHFITESIVNKSPEISEQKISEMLLRLAEDKYPYCKAIICDLINYRDLIKVTTYLSVSVSEDCVDKKTVTLPSDCFRHLVKFLNKADVMCLFMASDDLFRKNMDFTNLLYEPISTEKLLDAFLNLISSKKRKLN